MPPTDCVLIMISLETKSNKNIPPVFYLEIQLLLIVPSDTSHISLTMSVAVILTCSYAILLGVMCTISSLSYHFLHFTRLKAAAETTTDMIMTTQSLLLLLFEQ
jgi:hypothetical protein